MIKKLVSENISPQATVEDVDEEIMEYRRKAELGDKFALHNLGVAYKTGMGVAKD